MISSDDPRVAVSPSTLAMERYASAHRRGRALAELCRFQISRVPCLIMLGTAVAAGSGPLAILSGCCLIFAACAIGAALNDRADVLTDSVNQRTDRPLVNGSISSSDVLVVVPVAGLVIGLSEFGLPQPRGILVTAAAALVAWASACEPVALQRRGVLGLGALALGYLVLPAVLVLGFGCIWDLVPLVALGAAVLAHKDVRDEPGDRAAGKRTLLVQLGYRRMSVTVVLLGAGVTAGLLLTIGTGWWLLPATIVVMSLVLMATKGHSPSVWLLARTALLVTSILAAVRLAGT